jgi:serine/threonine protein kinase
MNALGCLPHETLLAYQNGTAEPAVIDAAATHLRQCGECLSRLQSLDDTGDPLLRALREQRNTSPQPIDPLVAAAIAEMDLTDRLLPAGTLLNEYRLLEKLGSGGMGTVYRALHIRLDKEVALKVIHPFRVRDPRMHERFGREMRAIGKLRHPHIVLATDAGEAQGVLYLVMELEQGADLAHYVRKQGPLPIGEACGYAQQAAMGLQCVHEAGLVHRDIKPSNLFRTANGQIKLLDLGLALLAADKAPPEESGMPLPDDRTTGFRPLAAARTLGPMGTDDYMAPEQWSDAHQVDLRVDLYSLGCTIYLLLTGQPPFALTEPTTRGQVRDAHLHQAPPPLRALRPDVPPQLEKLVGRLLAKQPNDRPASAAEVARQLSVFTQRHPSRALWRAAAALLLACAVVLLVAASWRRSNSVAAVPQRDKFTGTPQPGALSISPAEARRLQQHWAKHLGRPVVFQNTLGANFGLIPPGELTIVNGRDVVIDQPYYLGVTEVTVGQFQEFVKATGHRTWAETNGRGGVLINAGDSGLARRSSDIIWSAPGFYVENDDCPVVQVSWDDAVAFCDWLSRSEKLTYRLPTVSESIWASRAGFPGTFFVGGQDALLDAAWFFDNSGNRAHPVGQHPPNPWGLYDALGNVREWCLDDPPRSGSPHQAGKFRNQIAPATGEFRTATDSDYVSYSAGYGIIDRYRPATATSTLGFRVVLEIARP